MSLSAAIHDRAHLWLQQFLARPSTNAGDLAQLEQFLADDPNRTPTTTTLPADEVDERLSFLEYALSAPSRRRPFIAELLQAPVVDAFGLSVIFCLPLDGLRALRASLENNNPVWRFDSLSEQALNLTRIGMRSRGGSTATERDWANIRAVMQRRSQYTITGTNADNSATTGRNRAEADKVPPYLTF